MECYLVRHGRAQPGRGDANRSLTEEGREEIAQIAGRLVALGIQVPEIRHSGLARARETAQILARYLAPRRGVRQVDGLGPDDDPRISKAEIDAVEEPVMVVGHLPHLGRLAAALVLDTLTREIVRFHPGTTVRLAKTGGAWVVEWVLTPDLARAGGGS